MDKERNLIVWNAVGKTDPKFTKPAGFGGHKFTAIDAYWKIMKATEYFGPVGKGWGWDHGIEMVGPENNPMMICHLTLWYRLPSENDAGSMEKHRFSAMGNNALMMGQGDKRRIDQDCAKKCLTDAITKALSYLGFCNDVFMGKFDDSRYVEQTAHDYSTEVMREICGEIQMATTMEELLSIRTRRRGEVGSLPGELAGKVTETLKAKKANIELTEGLQNEVNKVGEKDNV